MFLYRVAVSSLLAVPALQAFAQVKPAGAAQTSSQRATSSAPSASVSAGASSSAASPKANAQSGTNDSGSDRNPANAGLDDPDETSEPEIVGQKGTGLSAVFGLDLGVALSNSEHTDYESSKKGYSLAGKALLSLYVEKMILEAGPGWMFNRVSGGPASQLRRDDETGQTAQEGSEVVTQTGFVEFSARYRPSQRWQVGPAAQVLFGGDSRFSPFPDVDKKANVLFGLVVANGDPSKLMDFRWGVELLTDLTISDRQVFLANLNLHFGVPLIKPDVIVKEKKVVQIKDRPVDRIVNRFFVILDTELVNFKTGSGELEPASSNYLASVGKVLAENMDLWEGLDIAGHTDNRGSVEFNTTLSRNRADEVKAILTVQGIPADRIRTYGFGPTRPIDNGTDEVALARNRRVEMSFEGVKNPVKLQQLLDRQRKSRLKPETCTDSGCK